MVELTGVVGFGKRVAADVSEKNVTFMAAGLAYHAFISLAPLLLLVFLIFAAVGSGLEYRVTSVAGRWLPGPIADVVVQLLASNPDEGVSALGLVVLLWGTLKIFRGLDTAFSEIYETSGANSVLDKFTDALTVFVALVVALVAVVGSSVVLGGLVEGTLYSRWAAPAALVAGLVVAFYPIYYVFPDADLGLREVFPGVVVAAVGWAALQGLFQLYVSVADPSVGSVFGGVIVVVTYLYFSALVLLLGAVVNAVSGDHAVGAPGGIGQGAASYRTVHEETFDRAEFAAYLWDRRAELFDEQETDRLDRRPPPDGDVEVTEQFTAGDDTNEWTVELRWAFDDEALAARRDAERRAADERAGRREPTDRISRQDDDRERARASGTDGVRGRVRRLADGLR